MSRPVDVGAGDALAGLPREIAPRALPALLGGVAFAMSFNSALLNPNLPEIARDLGVSVATAGQLAGVTSATGALAGLAMGTLSDLYGRRRFLVGGLALMGLAALGFAAAPSYPLALLCRALAGFGFVMAVALATVGDWYRGGERDRVSARMLAFEGLAWIAGVPVMALAAQLLGWRLGVGAFGVALVALAAATLAFLPDRPATAKGVGPGAFLRGVWREHRARPALALALAANAVRNSYWVGSVTFLGAFFASQFALAIWQVGVVLAFGAAVFVVGTEIGGRAVARFGADRVIGAACLGSATFSLGLPFAPTLSVGVGLSLANALINGAANAAIVALVLRLAPASRGATMALNSGLTNLGAALGVALVGAGIAAFGFVGLGVVPAALALGAAALISRRPAGGGER